MMTCSPILKPGDKLTCQMVVKGNGDIRLLTPSHSRCIGRIGPLPSFFWQLFLANAGEVLINLPLFDFCISEEF